VYSEGGSFYRCSKQAAELYVEEYQRLYALDYTILRFGTVYGPRADDYNSVRRYLKQALRERRIAVDSTGDEMREYVHIRDAAQLSVKVLGEEFRNEHLVLTGHNPMRFRDLLFMIRDVVGRDVEVVFKGPDPDDPKHSASGHYSITPYAFRPKTAKKLVNNPYLDMGQGLIECLEEIYQEHAQTNAASSPST
jgi:UDP-glucose 4-epimerase